MNTTNLSTLREIPGDQLTNINGGTFAYDVGRFIRYMTIYVVEGTGIRGTLYATADAAAVYAMNIMN